MTVLDLSILFYALNLALGAKKKPTLTYKGLAGDHFDAPRR